MSSATPTAPPRPDGGLPPDHPLFDLQSLAALTQGEAELWALVPDEEALAPILEAVSAASRGAPDAELLDHPDGRSVLSARIGPCSLSDALHLVRALSHHTPDARLLVAEPAARRRAIEEGRLVVDELHHRGLVAGRWTRVDHDAPVTPEVDAYRPHDAEVLELLRELRAAAIREAGCPRLPDDGAVVIVRRRDGRVGLRLRFDGPADIEVARSCFRAVADLIYARAGHTTLRLAPDALWDLRLGPEVTTWLIVAPSAHLPPATYGPWGAAPPQSALLARLRLQVDAGDDEATMLAQALDARRPGVVVGAPLRTPDAPRVLPTLELPPAVPLAPAPTLRPVPDLMCGLEAHDPDIETIPYHAGPRWIVRARDVLLDRDLVEQTTPRPSAPDDHELAVALTAALDAAGAKTSRAAGDRWLTPVHDGQERRGLRLLLDARAHRDPEGWQRVTQALAFDDPRLEPVTTAGLGSSTLYVHLWYRAPTASGPRPWRVAP